MRRGFTWIEFAIVLAFLLVGVTRFLPNFSKALVRSQVSRAQGEMRLVKIALEHYKMDWDSYPSRSVPHYVSAPRTRAGLVWLTSPVTYLESIPDDPFADRASWKIGTEDGKSASFSLMGAALETSVPEGTDTKGSADGVSLATWAILSPGPDTPQAEIRQAQGEFPTYTPKNRPISTYNPTNGAKSRGDLLLYGGNPEWVGVAVGSNGLIRDLQLGGSQRRKPGVWIDGQVYKGEFPRHAL